MRVPAASSSGVFATTRMVANDDVALLVVLSGPRAGERFVIEQEAVIGRDADAGVFLEGVETISRKHARLARHPGGKWQIEDLGSANGTSVNGTPVDKALLDYGDKIRLGEDTILLFGRHDPLEEQLFATQRMQLIGRMAAGIAHDFRNVLSSLLTNANCLASPSALAPGDFERCVSDIATAAERGVALTEQLLSFAAPGSGEGQVSNVGNVAADVARLVARTQRKSIQLTQDIPTGSYVVCPAAALMQVLLNLLVNAADEMPNGGAIHVSARSVEVREPLSEETGLPRVGPHLVISVQDDGPGMDAETARRAFDPFFTTKPLGQGTGLGLATVARIVADHRGHVALESEMGEGTRFDVYLPVGLAPSVDPSLRVEPASSHLAGNVLVVDDDALIRESLQRALARPGLRCVGVGSGEEALSVYAARSEPFAFVILDLDMPGLGGEATLHRLLAVDPHARVLIVTGGSDPVTFERLRAAGAVSVLPKPFGLQALVGALAKLSPTEAE